MQSTRLTEQQLKQELQQVNAAQKNPQRFNVLYEKYYKQIFLFVYKRTGDEDICGDIVSQVFLKALVNIGKYTYRGVPFSAWLYRIASNEINQYFREQQKDRTISIERNQIGRLLGIADDEVGEDHYDEKLSIVLGVIKELNEDDVQLIELRFFEKKPFSEVAYIMNLTETNAKVRMSRLLERIRKLLKTKVGGSYEA